MCGVALNNAVVEKDYRLFIYQICSDLFWHTINEKGEVSVFELIDYDVTDLLIIFDETFKDKSIVETIYKKATEHNTPVIFVGTAYDGGISFLFDYVSGFEQVVRHIAEFHKVKSFHMIAGLKNEPCSEELVACFKRILAENDIPFSDDMVSYGDYWSSPTIRAVKKLINEHRLPECIVCVNDSTAITTCSTLKDYGIEPAKDVIITGFDGIEQARWTVPSITTAECSFPLAAKDIVSVCEKIFAGESVAPVNYISYVLRTENSCGCEKHCPGESSGEIFQRSTDRFNRYQDDERKLYELNVNLLMQNTPEDFSKELHHFDFYDTCIFVNKDFMDFSVNLKTAERTISFDDDMLLLFRANTYIDYPVEFCRKDIMPAAEHLLSRKFPYIFCALNYLDKPCGYLCFYFTLDYENYCKIPQYVTSINYAINNFIILKHQQYISKRIEEIYKSDYLTGMLTRKSFYIELDEFMNHTENITLLVASMDIDGLKYINDNYGHDDGDFAICSAANALKSIPIKRKICARFGGDELALCAVADNYNEQMVKDYIDDYIKHVNAVSGKPYQVSVSVGICIGNSSDFDFDMLYKKADEKMYSEKLKKPNRRKD